MEIEIKFNKQTLEMLQNLTNALENIKFDQVEKVQNKRSKKIDLKDEMRKEKEEDINHDLKIEDIVNFVQPILNSKRKEVKEYLASKNVVKITQIPIDDYAEAMTFFEKLKKEAETEEANNGK